MYHHSFLDEDIASTVKEHVDKLLRASGSIDEWKNSDFSEAVQFCDSATLRSVRCEWSSYTATDQKNDEGHQPGWHIASRETRRSAEDTSGRKLDFFYRAARSAAPCGMQVLEDHGFKAALDQLWEAEITQTATKGAKTPNPLFFNTRCGPAEYPRTFTQIISFHLSAAVAPLTEMSPMTPAGIEDEADPTLRIIAFARTQFDEWTKAFVEMATAGRLVLRFAAADCLAFCQTLRHRMRTGEISANFYRRQFSADRLQLDPEIYSEKSSALMFDTIETCRLADSSGAMHILSAAGPLLKDAPWATLHTESTSSSLADDTDALEHVLCGLYKSTMTLLGMSPVEYWTNATCHSPLDEYMLSTAAAENKALGFRIRQNFTWKFNSHLSGVVRPDLRVKEDDLVRLLQAVYNKQHSRPESRSTTMVAILERLQDTLEFDTASVCRSLLDKSHDPLLGSQMSTHGLYHQTQPAEHDSPLESATHSLSIDADTSKFNSVTIQIPWDKWTSTYEASCTSNSALLVEGLLFHSNMNEPEWIFTDVQVMFGTVEVSGERNTPEYSVMVREGRLETINESSLVATFTVPVHLLHEHSPERSFGVRFKDKFQVIGCFQSSLTQPESDRSLFVTRYPPGQLGNAIYTGFKPKFSKSGKNTRCSSFFTVGLEEASQVSFITGHLDVLEADGKMLLADKATVEVHKVSPFTFELVIGEQATYQLAFPVPVVKDGSKTRVARTSAYIEIIAPLAEPAGAQALDDFIFPTVLAKTTSTGSSMRSIPTALNIPHVNLDILPILDASRTDRMSFLTTLTSSVFSVRERKLRDQVIDSTEPGLAPSPRMNFKESLFTMFMLASGLQGGQTGLFAISHPERGGIHMLIFISALRLDAANASVVLDGCVIPFTVELVKSGRLDTFLLILRTLECCTITVDDAELVLWKKVLPALTERCRTWTHAAECEYAHPDAKVPLSIEPGKQVICSCGAGRLPEGFINLPEWQETAAQFATRLAISPTFSVPYVEKVFDPDMLKEAVKAMTSGDGQSREELQLRCRNCGAVEAKAGGPLKKCLRCLRARYCSGECQKKDWKKHRMECAESGEYAGL